MLNRVKRYQNRVVGTGGGVAAGAWPGEAGERASSEKTRAARWLHYTLTAKKPFYQL